MQVTPQLEPTLDEHNLLYQVVAVLLQLGSLNPSRIYDSKPVELDTWPEQDARERRWYSVDEACGLMREPELAALIAQLG